MCSETKTQHLQHGQSRVPGTLGTGTSHMLILFVLLQLLDLSNSRIYAAYSIENHTISRDQTKFWPRLKDHLLISFQGRTRYEEQVLQVPEGGIGADGQQYNDLGNPRNPETRRRERENVRAANEVMQVVGVVEDSIVAKKKSQEYKEQKIQDTFLGLRLMELGRAVLVSGVWGTLGLRRRILV